MTCDFIDKVWVEANLNAYHNDLNPPTAMWLYSMMESDLQKFSALGLHGFALKFDTDVSEISPETRETFLFEFKAKVFLAIVRNKLVPSMPLFAIADVRLSGDNEFTLNGKSYQILPGGL